MMLIIKISIFCFLILSVKVMFSLFFQDEDNKLYRMKEAADFIEYLRVYSCSMKMSLEEIISKYNFKNIAVKKVYEELICSLKKEECNDDCINSYEKYIAESLQSPKDFNVKLSSIVDFYGTSLSDILNNKLSYLKKDLDKYIENYEIEYKERKNLLNKLSLLVGCLIAIVLI